MAFHLKDLGWRGSGDAVVIVVLVLLDCCVGFVSVICMSPSIGSPQLEIQDVSKKIKSSSPTLSSMSGCDAIKEEGGASVDDVCANCGISEVDDVKLKLCDGG